TLLERRRITTDVTLARFRAQPVSPPPAQDFDLVVCASGDPPFRAPRAVWLRETDPAAPRPLRVAHLSDVHVVLPGAGWSESEPHLRAVIAEINRGAPDAVVLTGNVLDRGEDATLGPRAQAMLLGLNAPLFVIMGNHDHGMTPRAVFLGDSVPGWSN